MSDLSPTNQGNHVHGQECVLAQGKNPERCGALTLTDLEVLCKQEGKDL